MAPKQGFTGWNQDLFKLGTQFAQNPDPIGGGMAGGMGGGGNVWDQPQFQDPYAPGMGGYPQQSQQFDMRPQDLMYPTGPNSWDQPPQGAQGPQEGPPTDPKKDLNHPFWSSVGQYLGSDEFKDSLLAGVIVGQMATDPKAALQMTLQFKQQRDQRKFNAQQNQFQRNQQQEMMKQKAEVAKENKKGADLTKRIAKIQAGLQAGNVPPQVVQQWIADNGPPDEDNIGKAETDFALMQSEVKAQDKAQKEMKQVLGFVLKGARVPEKYKNDPIMQSVEGLGKERKDYTDQMNKNRLAISELRRKLYAKTLGKADDDTNKDAFRLALTDLDDANALVNNAITDVDTLEEEARLMGGDEVLAAISAKRVFLQKAINNYNMKHQTAADMVGSQGKSVTVPTPTAPKKTNRVGAALGLDE